MSVSAAATLHHTGILVNDLEKTAERLAQVLSVKWNVWTITPEHCFVNGQVSPFSFKVGLVQLGAASLELIAPHTGQSVYNQYLAKNGEGCHHICLAYADLPALHAAKAELVGRGLEMVQHGYTEGLFEFCYFQLSEPAMLLELLYIKELPPPEKTIG